MGAFDLFLFVSPWSPKTTREVGKCYKGKLFSQAERKWTGTGVSKLNINGCLFRASGREEIFVSLTQSNFCWTIHCRELADRKIVESFQSTKAHTFELEHENLHTARRPKKCTLSSKVIPKKFKAWWSLGNRSLCEFWWETGTWSFWRRLCW